MTHIKLQKSALFEGVDEQYVEDFLSHGERVAIKKGEFLFHQDERGDNMYFVESGKLEVLVKGKSHEGKSDDNEMILTLLEKGAVMGELCVFGQKTRSASVQALEDSTLIKVEGEDFRIRIYSKELDALLICYNIAKVLSERLMFTNQLLLKS